MTMKELKKKIQANTGLKMSAIDSIVKFAALITYQDPKAQKTFKSYGKLVDTNEKKRWSKPNA